MCSEILAFMLENTPIRYIRGDGLPSVRPEALFVFLLVRGAVAICVLPSVFACVDA